MSEYKLDDIKAPENFTEEETVEMGTILEEGLGSSIVQVWEKILKSQINGLYWTMAHLSEEKRTQATISYISGQIQRLEHLLDAPKQFIKMKDEIEKGVK